jgi:hypothetical protein
VLKRELKEQGEDAADEAEDPGEDSADEEPSGRQATAAAAAEDE